MKILVTGSSGTIGTELCLQLTKNGHIVTGIDRKPSQVPASTAEFHQVDLLEKDTLMGLKSDFDLIIHLAANARVHNLVINPDLALENVRTVHNVLEFARINKVPKVLFASSREVYGNQEKMPVEESRASQRFSESPYSSSKIFGESYCYSYKNVYGIDTKIVRFSNVYGRWDFSDRFIPKLIGALSKDLPFEIYGEKKSMSFTYIEDCVSGTIKVLEHWETLPMEVNVASDSQDRLVDVAQLAKKMMQSKSEITLGETLPGEVWNYQADVSVLKATGWKPEFTVQKGLERSIDWYRAQMSDIEFRKLKEVPVK
jgi:UDP-glucuronate 4-epimerase